MYVNKEAHQLPSKNVSDTSFNNKLSENQQPNKCGEERKALDSIRRNEDIVNFILQADKWSNTVIMNKED